MSGAEPFLLAASAGIGFVSAVQQSNAQNAAAKSAANVAESNRLIAEQDRIQNLNNARIAQDDAAREHRRQLADMRANLGSSGLEVAGSPLDALADSSIEMALDQRRVGYQGYVANRNGQIEINNYANQRDSANASKVNPYLSAGASLLSGGTKAY